jgi:DNA modification methylase
MIQATEIPDWLDSDSRNALVHGDSRDVLTRVPDDAVDCVVTSPPYWGVRDYDGESGLGAEASVDAFVDDLLAVLAEAKRVLKPTGSLWLNVGDTYDDKDLAGVPWRVALALKDRQDWLLRNDVVWNKVKGNPSAATDRLRVMHEYVFHFVTRQSYYYDDEAIREDADFELTYKDNGDVVSPTGVSGARYRRQIQDSETLSDAEKEAALDALDDHLEMLKNREIKDFRMVVRDEQRTTHGDSAELSGRARELAENGFYVLRYNADGPMPGNVWDIVPEDRHRDDSHPAVYPVELPELPIRATCPEDGVVLDPFVGTGTTVVAANRLGRRGLGIDASEAYLDTASDRLDAGVQTTFDRL